MNVFKAISAIGAVGANRVWGSCGLFWALTGWVWSAALCWIDLRIAILAGASWVALWVLGFCLSRKAQ